MELYNLDDYADHRAQRYWQNMSPFERAVIGRLDYIAVIASWLLVVSTAAAFALAAVLFSHLL